MAPTLPNADDTIEARCAAAGLRMTGQRRTIAAVLEGFGRSPDVEELYARASAQDPRISLATVYRTVKLFEESASLRKSNSATDERAMKSAERAAP